MICHHWASAPLRKLRSFDEKRADEGSYQGAATADRRPDYPFDGEYGPRIEKGDDPDPGRIQRARGCGHEGGNAEYKNAIIGDIVAHKFRTHVIVADRFEHGANARINECAGNDEEYHDDGQNEPEKSRSAVVRVIGDAVEPASVSLIFNNEILEDERIGERITAQYTP